jgi:hypothetical protein
MKANTNFREQVGQVTSWFKEWSECEQTVALYSLLKKLTPPQAKFLDQVLQQSLAECTDVKQMQKKANDAGETGGNLNHIQCMHVHHNDHTNLNHYSDIHVHHDDQTNLNRCACSSQRPN